MITFVGKDNDKLLCNFGQVKNVFSNHFINFLHEYCQKQLEFNVVKPYFIDLIDTTKRLHLSNSIIDCHGLNICEKTKIKKDWNFPYSIKEWNIFCMKMQNIMFRFCDEFDIDKSLLAPHTCWVEGSNVSNNDSVKVIIDDTDTLLNSVFDVDQLTHYRIIYFLKTPNSKFGLTMVYGDKTICIPSEENSLYIIPSIPKEDNYFYTTFPTDSEEHLVLMFDWYLHPKETLSRPAWVFPNKYNFKVFKSYIKDNMDTFTSSSFSQKILFKHYLQMFKKELKQRLAS